MVDTRWLLKVKLYVLRCRDTNMFLWTRLGDGISLVTEVRIHKFSSHGILKDQMN